MNGMKCTAPAAGRVAARGKRGILETSGARIHAIPRSAARQPSLLVYIIRHIFARVRGAAPHTLHTPHTVHCAGYCLTTHSANTVVRVKAAAGGKLLKQCGCCVTMMQCCSSLPRAKTASGVTSTEILMSKFRCTVRRRNLTLRWKKILLFKGGSLEKYFYGLVGAKIK